MDEVTPAVDHDYYWRPMPPPLGCKVQALTAFGVAVHQVFGPGNTAGFIAWTPLPKIPNEIKELLR